MSTPRPNAITQEEKEAICILWPCATRLELLYVLRGRTWNAIQHAARRLQVRRLVGRKGRTKRAWPDEQVAFLKAHYPSRGPVYVSEMLGRKPSTVAMQAHKLGIRVAKPVVQAKPKPLPQHNPRPKAANTLKPLAVTGAAGTGGVTTPRLNASKDQRLREERARAKDFSITAAIKALPADSDGRRVYAVAARQGGQAGITAFLSWKQQQAA